MIKIDAYRALNLSKNINIFVFLYAQKEHLTRITNVKPAILIAYNALPNKVVQIAQPICITLNVYKIVQKLIMQKKTNVSLVPKFVQAVFQKVNAHNVLLEKC